MDSLSTGDLAVALQQIFDGPHDHIVWELDDEFHSRVDEFTSGPLLNPENGSEQGPRAIGPFLPVPAGEGLPTALGLLEARRLLATDSWIAVVLREANLQTALTPEIIDQFQKVNRRFLLVVLQDKPARVNAVPQPVTPPANFLRSIPGLRDLAWDCTAPIEQAGPADLAEQLEFIDRENAPVFLFVQCPWPDGNSPGRNGQPFPDSGGLTGRIPNQDRKQLAPTRAFVDHELIKLARADSRLLLITERDLAGLLEFPDVLPDQYQAVDHFDDTLSAWCRGITAGGCRPVIWLAGGNGNGTFDDAWRNRPGLPLTFLLGGTGKPVFDGPFGPSAITPDDAPGIRAALHAALSQRDSRMVILPDRIPLPPEDPHDGQTPLQPDFSGIVPAESSQAAPYGFSAALLRHEREQVLATRLSPDVQAWFDVYSRVGHRPEALWKWCTLGAEVTKLPCVQKNWFEHLRDTKVLSIMLCVLLDDAADVHDNERLLKGVMQVVERQQMPDLSDFPETEQDYVRVALVLSEIYEQRVRMYPLYDVYRFLLFYDLLQYFNTMRYSCLLNRNLNLLNVTEHELYLPHAMHMMSFSTLDLMCTPDFEVTELGRLREAVWHMQCMGRVGNLLSTWKREIAQKDFTSGIFARAVTEGDLTVDQLKAGETRTIETAIAHGKHEQYFLSKWHQHKACLKASIDRIQSVDLKDVVRSQERFFRMHLACQGFI